MSIYSGFATRNQELLYDTLIGNVIAALSLRIVKFYRQEQVDERKFRSVLEHQCKYLRKLEKRKFLEPKYSDMIDDLLKKTYESEQSYVEIKTLQNTPQSLNRTLTMINSELKNLRELGDKEYMTETNSLEKISQKVVHNRRNKKRSKSKKDKSTIQFELQQLEDVKRQKMPELDNFKIRETENFRSRSDWMRETKAFMEKPPEKEKVMINEESIHRIMQGTKFRSKLYFK